MKQFIVLTAVLPILMLFVMQTTYDQKNNYAINVIHDLVYVAKEQAKEEGGFTWEIQERLERNLVRMLDISLDDISVNSRTENDIIYYRVEVLMKDVIAGGKLLGIANKDNQYVYVIDSYTKVRTYPEPELDPEPDPEPGEGKTNPEPEPGESENPDPEPGDGETDPDSNPGIDPNPDEGETNPEPEPDPGGGNSKHDSDPDHEPGDDIGVGESSEQK